jgi:hypothetical protein
MTPPDRASHCRTHNHNMISLLVLELVYPEVYSSVAYISTRHRCFEAFAPKTEGVAGQVQKCAALASSFVAVFAILV